MAAITHRINSGTGAVRLDGHSDYGMVLQSFWDQWGPKTGDWRCCEGTQADGLLGSAARKPMEEGTDA
jgi:hypothetical protein